MADPSGIKRTVRQRWHQLGVQEKLHLLIQGSLIVLFVISTNWVIARFEKQIIAHAEQRAFETADGLINGMNLLMLTGAVSDPANRTLLLEKMRQSEGVHELRIVRGDSVIKQFGPGLPEEQAQDEMDRSVLRSGKPAFQRFESDDHPPVLRVVVPFIAQQNFRGTNCLTCHETQAGSVNGAASVTIDLSKDSAELGALKKSLWLGHLAIQIFLSLLIWLFVRKLIVRNIERPIKKLQLAMHEIHRSNDLSKRADVNENNADVGEMARDFNALLESLERANERLELFAKMFENSGEAILITDADSNILTVNPAFEQITQYSSAEVVGKNPRMLGSGKQNAEFFTAMWHSIETTGRWSGEIWNRRKNGEVYPEWLSIGVVKNAQGQIINYISSFSDITKRKVDEQQIKFLAHFDSLTRLPNRVLFADRLRHALVKANRNKTLVGLMFLDLDKFKSINDTLGHLAGDQLLQSVAERLRACVRESDTLCRQGGDEFLILLDEISSASDIELVARKIMQEMSKPHLVAEVERNITFSIGGALYPDDAVEAEALIQCADTAMYRAKDSGRNNFKLYKS
ncbi:MAG: diguanylate cyclase [Sideroxydans sp.]|nr:diguanylate cyclase [Sideroxydans sp.]